MNIRKGKHENDVIRENKVLLKDLNNSDGTLIF